MDVNLIIENFRKNVTEHYFDTKGRVGPQEFWYFVLASVVVMVGVSIIASILHLYVLGSLVGLALLLPSAGLAARRIQDTGKDGSIVWVAIIPSAILEIVGVLTGAMGIFGVYGFLGFYLTIGWLIDLIALGASLYVIYLCIQPGTAGDNAYGPPPAAPVAPPKTA